MSQVRPATDDDIPELVRLREMLIRELSAEWGPPPAAEGWREGCATALAALLGGDDTRISVVDGRHGLACCGIGVVDRRLPNPYNPSGLVGHVFGVVTDPGYRRRGLARAVMEDLLAWFDGRGLSRVDLNASPDGQGLYRSLGFADHPDPTLSRKIPPPGPATPPRASRRPARRSTRP